MPAPLITVSLNPRRTEIKKQGWAKTRILSSVRPGKLTPMPVNETDEVVTCINRYTECDLPEDLWQDPDTGYLLLKPSSLRNDYTESSAFYSARIPLSALTVPSPISGVAIFDEPDDPTTGKPKLIALQRVDDTTDVPSIAGVPTRMNNVHAASNDDSMVFVAQTENLLINESVTVTVQPSGLATDRASAWFGIQFGDKYYIQLGMNGSAALWEYGYISCETGTPSTDWTRRKRFEYTQGGIDHTHPFQITIVAWGMDFISVMFSQATHASQEPRATSAKLSTNTFTFRVSGASGQLPRFDVTHNHYAKIEPAPVRIAMRKKNYQYAFVMAKVRYGSETTLTTIAETLEEPKGADVTVTPVGFFPDGTTATGTKYNEDGTAWNPATNWRFCPSITLAPSPDKRYTPELWGIEMSVPTQTYTSGTDEGVIDISNRWTSLSWRETAHPDGNELTMVCREDWNWQNFLKLDAGITVSIDGVVQFEGYVQSKRIVFDGIPITSVRKRRIDLGLSVGSNPEIPLRNNPTFSDMWDRLNQCTCTNFKSITLKLYGDIFREGLERAGFTSAEYDIDPALDALTVGGFTQADDWKLPTEDANIGDLFRRIIDVYNTQSSRQMRLVRRHGKWYAYLAAKWTPSSVPKHMIYLHSDILNLYFDHKPTDVERWALDDPEQLHMFGGITPPELYHRRPAFNSLSVISTDTPAKEAYGLAAFIAPHPRMLTDPTYVDYWGRTVPKTVGANEIGHLTTQNDVERAARKMYDDAIQESRSWVIGAEWQPIVEPDDFIWICGLNGIGDPISFGVWRVEELQPTIEHDNDASRDETATPFSSRRWSWLADYTLSWVAPYEDGPITMFSEVVPE